MLCNAIYIKQTDRHLVEKLLHQVFPSVVLYQTDSLPDLTSSDWERPKLACIGVENENQQHLSEIIGWKKENPHVPTILIGDANVACDYLKETLTMPNTLYIFRERIREEFTLVLREISTPDDLKINQIPNKRISIMALSDMEIRILSYFASGSEEDEISNITMEDAVDIRAALDRMKNILGFSSDEALKKFGKENNLI